MKSLTEHLWFEVPDRRGFVNITDTVETLVKKSGVQEGLCLINAMHITASTVSTRQKSSCESIITSVHGGEFFSPRGFPVSFCG
jgi:thiamine phosphate synthase YjbQ (UPF0047 family)